MGCCFSKEEDHFDGKEALLPKGKHTEKSSREESKHVDLSKKNGGGYKSPDHTLPQAHVVKPVPSPQHVPKKADPPVVKNVDLLGLDKPAPASPHKSAPVVAPPATKPSEDAPKATTPQKPKPAPSSTSPSKSLTSSASPSKPVTVKGPSFEAPPPSTKKEVVVVEASAMDDDDDDSVKAEMNKERSMSSSSSSNGLSKSKSKRKKKKGKK